MLPDVPTKLSHKATIMRRKTPTNGNYLVGKGRPPLSTRFKPGQSGNPKGRPKGAKGFDTFLYRALEERFEVFEKGKRRSIPAQELMARRLVQLAAKGDMKALAFLIAKQPEITRRVEKVEKRGAEATAEELADIYFSMVRQVR